MVIDGMTLSQILGGDEEEIMLASLAVRCSGVIVCRASPAQKAAIVLLMKRYHAKVEVGLSSSPSILCNLTQCAPRDIATKSQAGLGPLCDAE